MSSLNKTQVHAASKLFQDRPTVLPGTRVILDDAARKDWFDRVCAQMELTGIRAPLQIKEFCDLAGVPD